MAALVPIVASQDTAQTVSSTTYTDASCETAALSNGVQYAVLFRGNAGVASNKDRAKLRILHGATVIGEKESEGSNDGPQSTADQCQGARLITGDGTSTLKFQHASTVANKVTTSGSMSIVAIPLDLLVEGTDWFFSGTNASANELSNVSVTGWTTLRTVNFTLPDAGDYLVSMSAECNPSTSGSAVNAARVRFLADGAAIFSPGDTEYQKEWEDGGDWFGYSFAGVENLGAGVRTFAIECQSRSQSESNYRRSNILVVRAATFDQLVQTRDVVGAAIQTVTDVYADFTGLDTSYTPNQSETVVVMAATTQRTEGNECISQLIISGGAARNVGAGSLLNDKMFAATGCNPPTFLVTTDSISTAQTYKYQYRSRSGAANPVVVGRSRDGLTAGQSNLIVWSMEIAVPPVVADGNAPFFGAVA